MAGGADGTKRINYVLWAKVVSLKEAVGLGLGSLRVKNISLIFKWWWTLRINGTILWFKVIKGLHNLVHKPSDYIVKKNSTWRLE